MTENLSLQEAEKYRNDLAEAIRYFQTIADTIPHNAQANRHLAKISAVQVKMGSLATMLEYGG